MQNGVSSDVYERKREAKKRKKEGERGEEKKGKGRGEKKRKKKRRRDSPYLGGSALSHFEEDFLQI